MEGGEAVDEEVVDEFAAVVGVGVVDGDGEAAGDGGHGTGGGLGAVVPGGGALEPLGGGVGECGDVEEGAGGDAAAEADGVDLEGAGGVLGELAAGQGGDGVLQLLDAGVPVAFPRLLVAVALEEPPNGGGADVPEQAEVVFGDLAAEGGVVGDEPGESDRKSTRLNSSH